MERIFCVLERIGGYSGKRIQIKRIKGMASCIITPTNKPEKKYKIFLASKPDVLKVKEETIDLDKFMRSLQIQGEIFNEQLLGEFEKIIDLYYNKGEVDHFNLISIRNVIKIIKPKINKKYVKDFEWDEFEKPTQRRGEFELITSGIIDINKYLIYKKSP